MPCKAVQGHVWGVYNGEKVKCYVSGEACHDPNWGADADGNRGISMDYVDDLTIDECEDVPENEWDNIKIDDSDITWYDNKYENEGNYD